MATPNFGGNGSPTPPSTSSSVILTYGENTAFQPLPEVGGYGGSVAFPKAPEPTAAPASKSSKTKKDATPEPAPTPVAVSIGATLSIVKPQDGPDLNFVSGKGKRKKSRELPARALAYITLLPTHDAVLESFPRVQLDVPREVASQYRDGEFGLALWNSGEKDSKYRLAVAELDTTTTPPPLRQTASVVAVPSGSPGATARGGAAAPTTTPKPAATFAAGGSPAPGSSASPGTGTTPPTAAPTLPPARLLFSGTATPLKLVANRPAVFALYALPHPATPAPKTSGSPAASSSSAPKAAASSAPSAAASASPAATKAP